MMKRRNNAAAERFADRRRREQDAPRLADQVPALVSLEISIDERSGASGVKHTRRVVVDSAPALFLLPCGDSRCADGEHDLTTTVMRALRAHEDMAVPRVLDIYAAMPAITGKIELEYEGELKGGDAVSRELIRAAVGKTYNRYFEGVNMQPVVQWFDIGGNLKLEENVNSADVVRQLNGIQGLMEKTRALGLTANEPDAVRASAGEFILEGLYAQRKISRSEERGFTAEERKRPVQDPEESPRARQRRQFN